MDTIYTILIIATIMLLIEPKIYGAIAILCLLALWLILSLLYLITPRLLKDILAPKIHWTMESYEWISSKMTE